MYSCSRRFNCKSFQYKVTSGSKAKSYNFSIAKMHRKFNIVDIYIVFLIGSFNCGRQLTTSFKLLRSPFQVIIFFTFVICACISVQIFLKLNMNIFSTSSWDWLHGSRRWWTISTPGPCGYLPLSSSCSTSSTGSPTDTWGQSSSPSPSHVPRVPTHVAPQPPPFPSRNAVILQ